LLSTLLALVQSPAADWILLFTTTFRANKTIGNPNQHRNDSEHADEMCTESCINSGYNPEKVANLYVVHCDETGADLNGKLHWIHCICDSQ